MNGLIRWELPLEVSSDNTLLFFIAANVINIFLSIVCAIFTDLQSKLRYLNRLYMCKKSVPLIGQQMAAQYSSIIAEKPGGSYDEMGEVQAFSLCIV